jgi:hypothetical protein
MEVEAKLAEYEVAEEEAEVVRVRSDYSISSEEDIQAEEDEKEYGDGTGHDLSEKELMDYF